jgi:CelD/BcsL family acetyltransferase involved in cellulose biosynthesis
LCIQRRLTRRYLLHVGGHAANLTHFFYLDGGADIFKTLTEALRERTDWDIFALDRVLSTEPYADAAAPGGFYHSVREAGVDGIIDLTQGYDAVIGGLPKRLRRYLKTGGREARMLLGKVELQRVNGEPEIRRLFGDLVRFSIEAYSRRGRVSAFRDRANGRFFEDVMVAFDGKNRLDAHRFAAGGVTLGISFGYRFGNGFKWILNAYNPEYSQLRPGHMLIEALVREAVEKRDEYFDMYYGGEMLYKQQWCNTAAPLKKVVISRDTFVNRSIIRLQDGIRNNERIYGALRRIKESALRLRGAAGFLPGPTIHSITGCEINYQGENDVVAGCYRNNHNI